MPQPPARQSRPERQNDIIVLSDFHMGRGRNPETNRYYCLETFFYDEDFLSFARYLIKDAAKRTRGLTVVFNGDIFDLLRIEPEGLAKGPSSLLERCSGAPHTPEVAARLVGQILSGHQAFLRGIAELMHAGHEVVFLPGNHDQELQWEPVQKELRDAVAATLFDLAASDEARRALSLLRVEPWFYYEPGRIWIEHGCQYDPENAFEYFLRTDLSSFDRTLHEAERDLPLGNFFQKYLYNGFGHVTFIVPTSKSNLRYMKWLLLNQPRLLFTVMASHLPFIVQVLRRLAKSATTPFAKEHLRRQHTAALIELARSSGLNDRLFAIDGFKEANADVLRATRSIGWQMLLGFGATALVASSAVGLWFVGLLVINALNAGFLLKALLFMGLNLFLLATIASATAYALMRTPRAVPQKPVQRAAERLASTLGVPVVSFGHTHEELIVRLKRQDGGKAWYYNTGTWIAVFTHDVLVPRERVQYTFLRVREDTPELLFFSPGHSEPQQVILLDESPATSS